MNTAVAGPTPACAGAWRQRPYRETLALRDGRRVLLRPMHRSDADALQLFFTTLSPSSRLLRFHGAVNRLPEAALRSMTTLVPQRHVALVALAHTDDGLRRLLAEARYVIDDDAPAQAEFALAVADGWQGQGLGRALLQRLAMHARSEGVQQLLGSVVPGNQAMLGLGHALGASLHSDGAEVRLQITL